MAKKTMKAQVFHKPNDMRVESVPLPRIADDEILVRVKACGICGSDIAYYYGLSPLETPSGKGPLVLGHEFTGQVVEVGRIPARRKLFKPGDRVVLDPLEYCYACDVCGRGQLNLCENKSVLGVSVNGGFAEYAKAKYTSAHILPENVSYEHGALTEPLACSFYAIKNLQVEPGMTAVLFGPGPIGLMMVQLMKSSGVGKLVVVGTRDYRLNLALALGADIALNTAEEGSKYYTKNVKERIAVETGGRLADRAITSTGSVPAMEMALGVSGRRSTIVFFGLPGAKDHIKVPALPSIFWDKTIRFSWLAPLAWPSALQALATGLVAVDKLVTHSFKLGNLVNGLDQVRNRSDKVMKAVVKP